HRICTVDLKSGKMAELKVVGLKAPSPPVASHNDFVQSRKKVRVANQTIRSGKSVQIAIPLSIPSGFKLNPNASIVYRALGNKGQEVVSPGALGKRKKASPSGGSTANASLALTGTPGKATVDLAVSYQVCRDGKGGLCKLLTIHWTIPLTATPDSKNTSLKLPATSKPAPKSQGKKKSPAKKAAG
ncbi:MAG: hypothetical protein VX311_00885, partial [Planctomycetota bacterium]|nr:hypothetical protein [Planctomycetota bacterium]